MAAAGFSFGLAAQAFAGPGWQGQPSPQFEPTASSADVGHGRELDEDDEIAALEAIRVALTDVADGVSYVWHRRYGQLSGLVQPTQSFKAADGRLCRHIIVILSAQQRSGRIEGTACRLSSGRWQLEG